MGSEKTELLLERLGRIEAALDQLLARTNCEAQSQEWFSIDEVAAITGLSSDHVRRHVTSGLLLASNMGTFEKPYYRIHRRDVDEWMAKRRESAIPAKRLPKSGSYVSRHHRNP